MKDIQNYQEFLESVQFIDQTYFIDTILKQDKHLNHFNDIYNRMEYRLLLSDGDFLGSDHFLDCKRKEIITRLWDIKQMLAGNCPEKDCNELLLEKSHLETDINKMEDATGKERPIFYWYLVPYWLADILINMGEVVFRGYFCHWWGVSSLFIGNREEIKEIVLLRLFQNIFG